MTAEDEYTTQSTRSVCLGGEDYRPFAIRLTKGDGSRVEYNLGCGLSLRDLILVLGCYAVFYSGLLGFSSILLKGAIDTAGTSTLLWAFFVIGLIFGGLVGVAVKIGTKYQDDLKQTQLEAEREKLRKSTQENILP